MENEKQVSHVEISDGDTMILSIKECPLAGIDCEPSLMHGDVRLCVNGTEKCDNLYKFWSTGNKAFMQCAALSVFDKERGAPRPVEIKM